MNRYIENGELGYKDHLGNIIIPAQYEWIEKIEGLHWGEKNDADWFICSKNGYWGVADNHNCIILSFAYDEICPFMTSKEQVVFSVRKGAKWGLVGVGDSIILDMQFDGIKIIERSDDYIITCIDSKYGILDKDLNEVLPIKYDSIIHKKFDWNSDIEFYARLNDRILYFDKYGKSIPVIKVFLSDCDYLDNNATLYRAGKKNGRWGVVEIIDEDDNEVIEVIPFEYESRIWCAGENLFYTTKGGKYGYINLKNETIIPFIYDEVRQFVKGLAPVRIGTLWGIIDKQGRLIVTPMWQKIIINHDSDIIIALGLDGYWVLLNKDGNIIASDSWEQLEKSYYVEYYLAYKNGYWGILEQNGKLICGYIFDEKPTLSNSRPGSSSIISKDYSKCFIVSYKGKKALYSSTGIVLTPSFDDISFPYNGVSIVKDNGKTGLYSILEGLLVPCTYLFISYYDDCNLFIALTDGRNGCIINNNGEIVLSATDLVPLSRGLFVIKMENDNRKAVLKYHNRRFKTLFTSSLKSTIEYLSQIDRFIVVDTYSIISYSTIYSGEGVLIKDKIFSNNPPEHTIDLIYTHNMLYKPYFFTYDADGNFASYYPSTESYLRQKWLLGNTLNCSILNPYRLTVRNKIVPGLTKTINYKAENEEHIHYLWNHSLEQFDWRIVDIEAIKTNQL